MTTLARRDDTVALYARVSSDEQREQQSVRTQLEYARGRAKLEGWTLREFVDDGVSGKKLPLSKRPAGAALLEAARRGDITRVVTYRLDRLGRRARFIHEALEDLTVAGVAYQSLTEPFDTGTPAGKLFLGILAVMAEFESDSITQRTADGRARVAQIDHRWLGGPAPFGYTSGEDKVLVVNPEEAAVVREIFALSVERDLGAQRIADNLNARGIPYTGSTGPRAAKKHPKQAAPWHAVAVNDILRDPLRAGRASYYRKSTQGREIVYRDSPPIVSQALFAAAQAAVDQRAKWGGSHAKHDYLLRGLLVCGRDGRNLIGRKWYGRGDGRGHNRRPIYYCEHCPAGARPVIDESQVLDILWRDVLDFLDHPDAALRAMARTAAAAGEAEDTAERSMLSAAEEIREIETQEERLVDLTLKKLITPGVLQKKANSLRADRDRAEQRLVVARNARGAALRAGTETAAVKRLLSGLRERAETIGHDDVGRALIVRTVTSQIVAHRAEANSRLEVTYAFQGPSHRATSERTPSSVSLAPQTASGARSPRTR
ncbi:MAG TPA: recombinase family protein [Candidatus Limnocylindria bacterium]